MAKATYRLTMDELSDIVDTTAKELMDRFAHRLPRGAHIEGSDHIKLGSLEIPRYIVVTYNGSAKFPKTKLKGLYKLAKK